MRSVCGKTSNFALIALGLTLGGGLAIAQPAELSTPMAAEPHGAPAESAPAAIEPSIEGRDLMDRTAMDRAKDAEQWDKDSTELAKNQAAAMPQGEEANPALAISSEDLNPFNVSDEQIQLKCSSAIAARHNMVISDDGRRITTCEQNYETLRKLARDYRATESQALWGIDSGKRPCLTYNTQENCVAAGKAVNDTATEAYVKLGEIATEAEERLVQIAGGQ